MNIRRIFTIMVDRLTVFLEVMSIGNLMIKIADLCMHMTIEMIKAAGVGRVLFNRMTEMPLADHRRVVTGFLKTLRQEVFIKRDATIFPWHKN